MENKLLKKLNVKSLKRACVLNAPASFRPHQEDLAAQIPADTEIREGVTYDFALVFIYRAADIPSFFAPLKDQLADDAVLWMAYPKKSSKKYQSDISRDSGWQILGDAGYEGVRMVAIDEDWSALRFRDATYIKNLTRDESWVMSKQGKKKVKDRKN